MQPCDEVRPRRMRMFEDSADRAEQRRVLRRVPERVRREEDVCAGAGGGGGGGGGGEERRRVRAPRVWDDGAVGARVVARHVLPERVDELRVGEVTGDDVNMWVALGDEDAGQACARAELDQAQGWCILMIGGGGLLQCGEIEL